ncbi:ClpXP adapter SpxH family protein [Ectobacillus sp. sgz5001026]|uniref:ClpXP adapter SpxH family protein n=1 Tax=Ectobacillus sp. sgz5001026 TaxID=3242473 RepID=UPI0036D22CA0
MNKPESDKVLPMPFHRCVKKPIEAFLFIDPLCGDCWTIEPLIIKFILEYGDYFSLRYILTGKAESSCYNPHTWNKPANIRFVWEKTSSLHGFSCDGKINMYHFDSSPYVCSFAVKAAELQGRKAGSIFLRKLREHLFLHHVEVPDREILISIAKHSGIDVEEFTHDLHSASAAKAFQCDLKFTNEMHITEVPSLIFFQANSDEEGVKVAGIYSYTVYAQVLKEMMNEELLPKPLPTMEETIKRFEFLTTDEIATIYELSVVEAEMELKKLQLKRKVAQYSTEKDIYWMLVKENDSV